MEKPLDEQVEVHFSIVMSDAEVEKPVRARCPPSVTQPAAVQPDGAVTGVEEGVDAEEENAIELDGVEILVEEDATAEVVLTEEVATTELEASLEEDGDTTATWEVAEAAEVVASVDETAAELPAPALTIVSLEGPPQFSKALLPAQATLHCSVPTSAPEAPLVKEFPQ